MRRALFVLCLTGCGERPVISVSDEVTIDVAAGDGDIEMVALLAWDGRALPERVVSNALRLGVTSDVVDSALALDYPRANPDDVFGFFEEPESLNLSGVFRSCEEDRCERLIDVHILREVDRDETLVLSGDAIYTVVGVGRRVGASMRLETVN